MKPKQGVLTAEKLEEYALGYKVFKGWQGYANGVLEHLRLNFNYKLLKRIKKRFISAQSLLRKTNDRENLRRSK